MKVLEARFPPGLQATAAFLRNRGQGNSEAWFEDMARKYLPEDAPQILRMTAPWPRVLRFAAGFSRAYFPLNTDYLEMLETWHEEILADDEELEETPYEILQRGIPYELYGYTYEEFHEIFENRDRMTCLAMLLVDTRDFYMMADTEDQAAREVTREGLAEIMPLGCLREIPRNGFTPEVVWAALEGTPLEPLALRALWLIGETRNFFLDNQLDPEWEISYGERWDEEIIQVAAREWQQASHIMQRTRNLADWMDLDFGANAQAAVELLMERAHTVPEQFLLERAHTVPEQFLAASAPERRDMERNAWTTS